MGNKSKNLGWKIGGGIIVLFIGLIVGFGFWLAYEGDPKEIVSVADQFKPKPEWQLTQNSVEPPRNSCIDIVCPSVGRSWILPQKLNRENFEQIAYIGNTKLTITPDCFEKDEEGHVLESCDAVGIINNYDVVLTYYGRGIEHNKPVIILNVERRN